MLEPQNTLILFIPSQLLVKLLPFILMLNCYLNQDTIIISFAINIHLYLPVYFKNIFYIYHISSFPSRIYFLLPDEQHLVFPLMISVFFLLKILYFNFEDL